MKKLLIAITLLSMSSCSHTTPFLQIGSLSSDNVRLDNKGNYEYNQNDLTISYDFWSNGGKVSFVVTNNSSQDIYLLMDKSYFINNGMAYDYYANRNFIIGSASSSTTTSTIGRSISGQSQLFGLLNQPKKTYISLYSPLNESTYTNASIGVSASRFLSSTESRGSQSSKSVETPEPKIVCIPANSSKSFAEFYVSGTPHRQCGFARDAKEEDGAKITFNSEIYSPQCIENRLTFNINGEVVPVTNTFYVNEYTNIMNANGYAYISDNSKDCNGKNNGIIKIYKHATPNNFYITYQYSTRDDNDRIDVKKSKSKKSKKGKKGKK